MADQPSPASGQGPRSPAPSALSLAEHGPFDPARGEAVGNPLSAGPTVSASGRALYDVYCATCHGSTGSGTDAAVAKYFPRVGDLGSADVQKHGDGWLYATITAGTAMMPAYGHELDSRERWQIIRYVRTLAHR